eukprot:Platyproteum_vivax@DN6251_c0_g1_i2.p1
MVVVCLGPVCIPVWSLVAALVCFLKPFFLWIKYIFTGKKYSADVPLYNGGPDGGLRYITTSEDWQAVLTEAAQTRLPIVIDFWATWCKPCMAIGPHFQAFSTKYAGYFAMVDVDILDSLTAQYDASILPTFIVLKMKDDVLADKEIADDDFEVLEKLIGASEKGLHQLLSCHCSRISVLPFTKKEN